MKNIMTAVAIGAVLSMGGCGIVPSVSVPEEQTTGVQVRSDQMASLKDRYSTTLAVTNRLGQPTRTVQKTNGQQWFYDYTHTYRSAPQNNISESAVFEFDRSGILISHTRVTPMAP